MGKNELARNLLQQEPGRDGSQANAVNIPKLAHRNPRRHTRGTEYRVSSGAGDHFIIAVKGRSKWALDRLRKAGECGCTPIKEPAPRWSAYIHCLREIGVEIETIHEPHDGDYPGRHGRYVLRSTVAPVAEGGAM